MVSLSYEVIALTASIVLVSAAGLLIRRWRRQKVRPEKAILRVARRFGTFSEKEILADVRISRHELDTVVNELVAKGSIKVISASSTPGSVKLYTKS